jgi:hypothetical protein
MPGPTTKTPSKKTFHFPKTAETEAAVVTPAVAETAAPPVAKRKAAAKAVEAATQAQGKAAKTAAKGKDATAKAREPAAVSKAKDASAAEDKAKRLKKEKVVRDSFTMPKSDYEKIAVLKQKCLSQGVHVKKGELLRAGLQILEAATIEQLIGAVGAVETVKTGRPGKS